MQPPPGRLHDGSRKLARRAEPCRRPQLLRPELPGSACWSCSATSTATSSASTGRFGCCGSTGSSRSSSASQPRASGSSTTAGRPYAYVSASTVTVAALRRANWHAFEEGEREQARRRDPLVPRQGPIGESGLVESQRKPRAALCARSPGAGGGARAAGTPRRAPRTRLTSLLAPTGRRWASKEPRAGICCVQRRVAAQAIGA